jgi:hypothetical protein
MTALAEDAEAEVSEPDRLTASGVARIVQAHLEQHAGFGELIQAELWRSRSEALDRDDDATLAVTLAGEALAAPRDALARAQRAVDQAEALSERSGAGAASSSLRVRVRAKAEAAVIAGEVADARAARDAALLALQRAEHAVTAARRAAEATSREISELDSAIADPFGSALGRATSAWVQWYGDSGEWLNHLGREKLGSREAAISRRWLDGLLRASGRGAEIERRMDAGVRSELGSGAPAEVLPNGVIVSRHDRQVRTEDEARDALLPIPDGGVPPESLRLPSGWHQAPGLPGMAPGSVTK